MEVYRLVRERHEREERKRLERERREKRYILEREKREAMRPPDGEGIFGAVSIRLMRVGGIYLLYCVLALWYPAYSSGVGWLLITLGIVLSAVGVVFIGCCGGLFNQLDCQISACFLGIG
eukprot:163946_1